MEQPNNKEKNLEELFLKNFGNRLKTLLAECRLSQREFGKLLNVDKNTVASWIKGINPPNPSNTLFIYKYFDVSLDWLILGIGKKNQHKDAVFLDDSSYIYSKDEIDTKESLMASILESKHQALMAENMRVFEENSKLLQQIEGLLEREKKTDVRFEFLQNRLDEMFDMIAQVEKKKDRKK